MIYFEYISRLPQVDVRRFHQGVIAAQSGWEGGQDDRLLWAAGRTWRLGPGPEYVAAWDAGEAGLERIDDWDRIFRSRTADVFEDPLREVARIEVAGCYEALLPATAARGGTYYAEFFQPSAPVEDIADFFQNRAARHADLQLNILVRRIGLLAPEPGGIAIWTIPDFSALAGIAAEPDEGSSPVVIVKAGAYADIGSEIL